MQDGTASSKPSATGAEQGDGAHESLFDDDELEKIRAARYADIRRRAAAAQNKATGGASTPYETLGVERTATQAQIRRRYHHLSLELHPDKNPGVPAAEAEAAYVLFANRHNLHDNQ